MRDDKSIQNEIYTKLYKRDVDYSLNIFLCGADTTKKDTIRDLLNTEFKKDAKFNAVYPEFIFSSLYGKGGSNLLELEDELANYVDVIILPLEGIGTFCELGAFAVNKTLLPKIIAINDIKYKSNKSFINLGPIDLIKSNNPSNLIFYNDKKEKEIISKVVDRVRLRKYEKTLSYDLENIFNLSRYILYLIAVFQPIGKDEIAKLIKLFDRGAVKTKYIDSALQILTQKNRIELDIDGKMENIFSLSEDGHKYVYEELITKLKVKNDFTTIRSIIINDRHKSKKRYLSKDKKLLV